MQTPGPRFTSPVICLALLLAGTAQAAVLTVGPNGTYGTLQAALNVAVSNGEDDEIRIQQGVLLTSATAVHAEDRFLDITGGWQSGFSTGSQDPALTVLSGNQVARVLDLEVSAGQVIVRYLSFSAGFASDGAGADFTISGSAQFELTDCEVLNNTATNSGAGIRVTTSGSSDTEVERCRFVNNLVQGANADGGGLALVANDGRFVGSSLSFFNNSAVASAAARGGAISIALGPTDPQVTLTRLQVRNNRIQGATQTGGAGLYVGAGAGTHGLIIEGAEFIRNRSQGITGAGQVEIVATDGTFRLRSIALLDGIDASGLRIDADGDAQVVSTNLTAAGNDVDGIRHEAVSSADQALQNSLSWANGAVDLVTTNSGSGSFELFVNSEGMDPGTIDPGNGDYRLETGSSAIDACSGQTVAGVGQLDAEAGPRVVNAVVDCGAYEWSADNEDAVFNSGFESP